MYTHNTRTHINGIIATKEKRKCYKLFTNLNLKYIILGISQTSNVKQNRTLSVNMLAQLLFKSVPKVK